MVLAPTTKTNQREHSEDGPHMSESHSPQMNTLHASPSEADLPVATMLDEHQVTPPGNDDPSTTEPAPIVPKQSGESCYESQEVDPDPGVMFLGKDRRKRMKPILELPLEDSVSDSLFVPRSQNMSNLLCHPFRDVDISFNTGPQTYGRKASRKEDQVYLGPESVPVDELFYGHAPLESELDHPHGAESSLDNKDFVVLPSTAFSSGRTLYVNARMKYYLQSPLVDFSKGNQRRVAIVPYPNHIGRKHYSLSITVFSGSPKFSTIRSNRSKWIHLTAPARRVFDDDKADAFHIAEPISSQDDHDDPDWKALEKWKYMTAEDDILPIYGESGSEGEYEPDTWKEMEREEKEKGRDELARIVGPSRSQPLAAKEVEDAICLATKQMEEQWHSNKKPKLERKAWWFWMKSRRDHTAKLQMDSFTDKVKILDCRLAKLREAIAGEEWSNTKQVAKQCKALEPSIFDREDIRWRIEVLGSRKVPIKFPRTAKQPKVPSLTSKKQPLDAGEEDLEIDFHDSESSDGSLGNFVVQDETEDDGQDPVGHNEDPFLADVEEDAGRTIRTQDADNAVKLAEPQNMQTPSSHPKSERPNDIYLKVSVRIPMSVVDLTLDSDPVEPVLSAPEPKAKSGVKTPPVEIGDVSDMFERPKPKKPVFKKPPVYKETTHEDTTIITLDSDSAETTTAGSPPSKRKPLPAHDDVSGIMSMHPDELVERQDRKRLLLWRVAHTPSKNRFAARKHMKGINFERLRSDNIQALERLLKHKRRMPEMSMDVSETIMLIASWHVCWAIPVVTDQSGIKVHHIRDTQADMEGFPDFYDSLLDCLEKCNEALNHVERTPTKKRKAISHDAEDNLSPRPFRKKKFEVTESQETLDKRQAAQIRMRGDDERRREEQRRRQELSSRLIAMGSSALGSSAVVVNPGKLENQETILLNPEFGNGIAIKEHQKEGLQFLWREITAEPDDLQGCLLAQTMGLGKTMQVIALLVALADSSRSPSTNICEQVPPRLREQHTLILCPPALLENWWDEFLIWAPRPLPDSVGEVRKVSVSFSVEQRLHEIQAWSENGGVLLIGYDTFKRLISDETKIETKKSGQIKTPHDTAKHKSIKRALLERANLVVADEAHHFKSRFSQVNLAMGKFQTRSRIALTGSPLNNNLDEYYTLIDWIAPNYLGSPTEFKATYEEPIREGLYQDSTDSQYYRSRTKLKALEMELEPKVHRADVSVLHAALHGKMEFVIVLPLTKIQEQLYVVFVNSMRASVTSVEPRPTSLWSWLGLLQLLCNHPSSFREYALALKTKLEKAVRDASQEDGKSIGRVSEDSGKPKDTGQERREPVTKMEPQQHPVDPRQSEKKHIGEADKDTEGDEEEAALVSIPGVPEAFVKSADEYENIFMQQNEDPDDPALSYKMVVLMRILDLSNTAGDKVLVFSHRIATLNYIQKQLERAHKIYLRIDGKTLPQKRQSITKAFNEGTAGICLISTGAGGTGLNLFGANRVVILDEHWNPAWEQQAVGRAYRIGQPKPVYVYRLTAGGTFEQALQNLALFKEQLATRVVDKKNPSRNALKHGGRYLYPPQPIERKDCTPCVGQDPLVLDRLLVNE